MESLTGIGEVVLRVDDLAGMEEFYGDVLGLEPWRTLPGLSFLRVADVERARAFYEDAVGLELLGDPRPDRCAFQVPRGQLLGLVDRTAAAEANEVPGGVIPPCLPGGSDPPATGSHLAFAIPREDLEPWRQRLIGRGVDVLAEVRWERGGRSLYFRGPEEALLELATPGVWEFY